MSKITKVVIPVAGFGTRFLPATKAQPKEMMPVVDKPIIQYVVEEAVASGITDVVLITGASKHSVENHFDYNYELQAMLKKQGKDDKREEIKRIADMANFIYVRQKGPYGNGTPVLCAKEVIGNNPFAVLWGDEFFQSEGKPRLKQLIEVYEKYTDPVLTAKKTDDEGTKKYGILDAKNIEGSTYQVDSIVEKPGPDKAPSRLASLGGFILTPDIFEELEKTKLGKDNELWLVDAIFGLMKKRAVYACEVDASYHDTGSKIGWLNANLEMGLKHPEVKDDLKKLIKEKTKSI